jgi:hypothetical protein
VHETAVTEGALAIVNVVASEDAAWLLSPENEAVAFAVPAPVLAV